VPLFWVSLLWVNTGISAASGRRVAGFGHQETFEHKELSLQCCHSENAISCKQLHALSNR